ncbi:hypothetical protein ANMWB30_23370 [Arthrobacter sp. MWB30]|nr:hypothetical protein ANMWB30_23370 [Arthrobacter sp. MWB30]
MKKAPAAIVAALVAVSVVGCNAPESSVPQPGYTSAAATEPPSGMPYSAFRAQDLLDIYSAVTEITYECYAENGYPEFLQVLPEQKANLFRTVPSTPDYVSAFDRLAKAPWFDSEDEARKGGYGHGASAVLTSVYAMDVAFRDIARTCATKADEKLPGSQAFIRDYSALGATLADALKAATARNWDEETEKIFACMSTHDFPVTPSGPNISPSWGVDFGVPLGVEPVPDYPQITEGAKIQIVPTLPAKSYVPTPQEAESAAVMHNCSIETGAREAWDRAMVDAESDAISKNLTKLTELNAELPPLLQIVGTSQNST